MVRPSPVPAKENDVPRAPSPLTKKPRPSMNNKRVSFGHVELHTFCKDADRTPSPMPPPAAPLFASAIDGRVETHAVVALRTRATPLPAAQQPHASLAGGPVLIDQAPQLSDLLRGMDEPSGGRAAPFEEDDDDVVFQPRAGGESVTMDFTQAYGGGIREVRTDAQSPAHEPAAVGMEFTRSYGAGILSSGGAEPMDEDEPVDAASLAPSPTPTFDAPTSQPAAGARAEPLTYEQFLANHGQPAPARSVCVRARARAGTRSHRPLRAHRALRCFALQASAFSTRLAHQGSRRSLPRARRSFAPTAVWPSASRRSLSRRRASGHRWRARNGVPSSSPRRARSCARRSRRRRSLCARTRQLSLSTSAQRLPSSTRSRPCAATARSPCGTSGAQSLRCPTHRSSLTRRHTCLQTNRASSRSFARCATCMRARAPTRAPRGSRRALPTQSAGSPTHAVGCRLFFQAEDGIRDHA
mgnify:CR=1 FL=1